jgi:hypothetical protein
MQLVSWSTKIRVTHNCQNKIDFQNLPLGTCIELDFYGPCIELESIRDAS